MPTACGRLFRLRVYLDVLIGALSDVSSAQCTFTVSPPPFRRQVPQIFWRSCQVLPFCCNAGRGAVQYQSRSPEILGASSSLLNLSEKMNIICCSKISTFAELFKGFCLP